MPRRRKAQPRSISMLPLCRPHAAGVDVGAYEIHVAVPPDRDPQPVRRFLTFTEDLHALADGLQPVATVSAPLTGGFPPTIKEPTVGRTPTVPTRFVVGWPRSVLSESA